MAYRIRVHKTGDSDVLDYEEFDPPAPADDEALVRHTAIGLNFIDIYHRKGLYPEDTPFTPGLEAAGIVEDVGKNVTGLDLGQRVAYASPPVGAYATHRTIPADRLVPLPDDIPEITAAAAMLKGMTVEYLLNRTYQVTADDTIVFTAAAGGVGTIAMQWARNIGATIIGTVGNEDKAELARKAGCDYPVLYREKDLTEEVMKITDGAGVPVVYDSVGKDTFYQSLDCLQKMGMLVSFGQASGKIEEFDPGLLSQKGSLYLTRPTLMDYTEKREDLLASADALFEMIKKGIVNIEVNQTFDLKDAARAHDLLESAETTGSTVLIP